MFNMNSWGSLRDNIWLELEGVNRVIQMRQYLKAATEKIWGQTKLKMQDGTNQTLPLWE